MAEKKKRIKSAGRSSWWVSAAIISLTVLCVVCAVFAFTNATQAKTITAKILTPDGKTTEWTIKTKAKFLGSALEEADLVKGIQTKYGLLVDTVDGQYASLENHEWWCFSCNGELLVTSVDNTPIIDGAEYEITFTQGW